MPSVPLPSPSASAVPSPAVAGVAPCAPIYDGQRYVMSDSVGHRMVQLVQMIRREVDLRMAEHGLTDAQWKPLWMLRSGRAGTCNELARSTDIDAGAMTRTVDRLAAKGLVERLRSDTDRRVVQLHLTAAGEAAADQVLPVLVAANNDFLRGFTPDEWQQLCCFLERMLANGQAMRAAQGGGE